MKSHAPPQIEDFGLIVSFIRVNIGQEFHVADRLKKRFTDDSKVAYYTCYGQFDLIEVHTVNSLDAINQVPYDQDVIDFELSLFHAWKDISTPIVPWAKNFPVLVFTFLNIHPILEDSCTLDIEQRIIETLKEELDDNITFFSGIGRSEILVIFRGYDFENLFQKISKFRYELNFGKFAANYGNIKFGEDESVLIGTASFPAIAHPTLLNLNKYNPLQGKVLPHTVVECHPGNEKYVALNKPSSCSTVRNIYGRYDVFLSWNEPIELSTYAKELTSFRQKLSENEGVKSTTTTFVGLNSIDQFQDPCNEHTSRSLFVKKAIRDIDSILGLSKNLNPVEKAKLIEFLGRLNSYYNRPESRSSLEDMMGLPSPLFWLLNEVRNASNDKYYTYLTYISQLVDLSNAAINQRYTGLETRFGSSKHLAYPFLIGIDRCIAAASLIPFFIFKSMYPEKSVIDSWSGFVLFGQSYSYQYMIGNILSYQASALYKPIEDWWGITHEAGHANFHITDFLEKDLPGDVKQHIQDIPIQYQLFLMDIEEIYVHWFDFTYIFKRNLKRYINTIWRSWLRWTRVKVLKNEYVFRSLAVFILLDLDELHVHRQKGGFPAIIPYLKSKFHEMKDKIIADVPEFKIFIEDVTEEDINKICGVLAHFIPYLYYLENEYFQKKVVECLNPNYPYDTLRDHISRLQQGFIVSERIPDPLKLLHELYDLYVPEKKDVPFKLTAAVIVTLWHQCIKYYRGESL
ncbi:MAG TPA: hypothetical protein VFG29_08570 [Syntrophales bacterium]|nr:hypothetical protein [Syntrophales bacterium]